MTYYRAIAIFLIVLGHTLWGTGKIAISNILLFTGGTTYFVFIAGFLFQYLSYKFNYKEYLKKKFFNVIMPYIVTTLPFAIVFALTLNDHAHPLYNMSLPVRFLSCFPCAGWVNGPTWFIGMISIFFVFAPIFLKLEKHKKVWYTLLLASIIYSIFVNRPSGNISKYIDSSTSAIKICLINFYVVYFKCFIYFLSSYIGGMTLCMFVQKYPNFIHQYKKQILTVLITALIIIYNIYLLIYYRADRQFLIRIDIILLIFCILYVYEKTISSIPQLDKFLKTLAKYSFGIFFIHAYIIKFIKYHTLSYSDTSLVLNLSENSLRAFLYSVASFFLTLFGSLLILWIIKTILNKLGVKNTRVFIGV